MIGTETAKNMATGIICLLALVNLVNTGSIRGTIYNAEDNMIKYISPITEGYVDTGYLGGELKQSTENIMNIPFVSNAIDMWEDSGAHNILGKVFAPMVNQYSGMEFGDVLSEYGLYFDEETGTYMTTDQVSTTQPVNEIVGEY